MADQRDALGSRKTGRVVGGESFDLADDAEQLVRVVNVSREGAMVAPALGLRIGEPVTLRLAGDIRVAGSIRWIRDGRMGINFDVPLVIEAA